ncbi:lactoylglutathione lyase [Rhizobium pisi]
MEIPQHERSEGIPEGIHSAQKKEAPVQLSLELFVETPEKSLDFYRRVLGFEVQGSASTEYTMLSNGDAVIAINSRSTLSSDHPIRAETRQRVGLGVEIVLKVADVEDVYRTARDSGWPLSDLALQPWGQHDFRLVDPDGYYIRVTSRHTS